MLTVAQPDLALYRGPSDEAFDEDGKRLERSIYSRPGINDESKEIPVTVTVKGYWKIKETPFCKVDVSLHPLKRNNGRVAQLNRVADYGSAGYRFESCRDHLSN